MAAFELIVLGCSGGPKESNLSGYLLAPHGQKSYIGCDAGTLLHGLEVAHKKGHFGSVPLLEVFQKQIKGYLISHPHLDHVAGLVVGSQVDHNKPIYGASFTLDVFRDHLFNCHVWPNYGNEGKDPIGQYSYRRLKPEERVAIDHTEMTLEMYPLRHAKDCPSAAFLIESAGHYVLYFGDTCSDKEHGEKRLETIWKRVSPLIREKKLKAILLECSFPKGLVGPAIRSHLDTEALMNEMRSLAHVAASSLEDLPLVVTHRKSGLDAENDFTNLIAEELKQDNDLNLHLIFPSQGEKFTF